MIYINKDTNLDEYLNEYWVHTFPKKTDVYITDITPELNWNWFVIDWDLFIWTTNSSNNNSIFLWSLDVQNIYINWDLFVQNSINAKNIEWKSITSRKSKIICNNIRVKKADSKHWIECRWDMSIG